MLVRYARRDYWHFRLIAATTLPAHFTGSKTSNSNIFEWLQERAAADAVSFVRQTAVEALADFVEAGRIAANKLRELASDEMDAFRLRQKAVAMLGWRYADEPETLQLLDEMLPAAAERENLQAHIAELERTVATLEESDAPEEAQAKAQAELETAQQEQAVHAAIIEARNEIRRDRAEDWVEWLTPDTAGNFDAGYDKLPLNNDWQTLRVGRVRLRDIKAFADTRGADGRDLEFAAADWQPALLLGDNSAGKSTLLRAFALAALGAECTNKTEPRSASYLRHGAERGIIEVEFYLQLDEVNHPDALARFYVGLEIRRGETAFRILPDSDLSLGEHDTELRLYERHNAAPALDWLRRRTDDRFGVICGYGALRALADTSSGLLPEANQESFERVYSLFRAHYPLADPDTLARMLNGDISAFRTAPSGKTLDAETQEKMRAGLGKLLPGTGAFALSPDQPPSAATLELNACPVPLRDLSEGYGGFLALVGHLFRQGLAAQNWQGDPTRLQGLVLIDEIDAHLHPSWQRRVLPDLQTVFPGLQIIATSHSPMVATSVSSASIKVLKQYPDGVRITSDLPSTKGWRADQILTSELFNLSSTLGAEDAALFTTYARLLNERGPQDEEVQQLAAKVSAMLRMPTDGTAKGEGVVDEATHQLLDELLDAKFARLDKGDRKQVLAQAEALLSD